MGGEAGVGKSRLLAELTQCAERLGGTVMSGVCSEAELFLPYLAFLEAIGNYLASQDMAPLRERPGSGPDDLAQLVPQMGRPGSESSRTCTGRTPPHASWPITPRGGCAPRMCSGWLRIAPMR